MPAQVKAGIIPSGLTAAQSQPIAAVVRSEATASAGPGVAEPAKLQPFAVSPDLQPKSQAPGHAPHPAAPAPMASGATSMQPVAQEKPAVVEPARPIPIAAAPPDVGSLPKAVEPRLVPAATDPAPSPSPAMPGLVASVQPSKLVAKPVPPPPVVALPADPPQDFAPQESPAEVRLARGLANAGPREPMSAAALLATLLAGVLGLQAIGLLWFDVKIARRGAPGAALVAPASVASATPAGTIANLDEAFSRGPVSPRGVTADGVSPARALERAHGLLRGGSGQRDTEEAAFWLKHHLQSALGSERTRIVLTQLGSAYADPSSGQPEFGKARVAWELSAAFGDPVAMCFLAAVHERGLGVVADEAVAGGWLKRAGAAGGRCPTRVDAGGAMQK